MLTEATIFRGAFWFSLGALFERVMFLFIPIFIAPLGPSSLGIFHLSLRIFHGIVHFLSIAINAKYSQELRQYIQDPKSLRFEETAAYLLKANLLAGLLLGIFFFILTLAISPLKSLAFLALAIPFAVTNYYMMHLLQLLQRFKKIFSIQTFLAFGFQLLYMVIFIRFFRLGIAAAFLGQLLMVILIAISAFFFLFDRLNLLGFFQKINLKMFALSRLSFANVLFTTVSPVLDLGLVGLLFGFSVLGHYIVLLYLPLLMHKIPTTLFGMFLHVAAVKTRINKEDITQISQRVFKWILLVTIPVFITIMLYPEPILSVLFHKSYVKDLNVIPLFAISFFIQSVSWTAGRILLAKKETFLYVVSNYIFGFVFVLLAVFLANPFALFGIGLAFLTSSILDVFVKYIWVTKKANVSFIGIDHIKILLAGAIGGLLTYIFSFNNPLLSFPFFLLLYFAILWVMRVVDQKVLFDLKKMVVKEITIGEF